MFNYSGLLRQPAEYIPGSFDPDLVTVKDLENYFNHHRCTPDELQVISPDTNEKIKYEIDQRPWRPSYDPSSIENLWEQGFSFILHSPYINKKVKQITQTIESSNFVSCDAHIYCGKKQSASFHPHSDDNFNLIVQCAGQSAWRVWDAITPESGCWPNLQDDPMIKVVMSPGDAIIIPKGQVHQAEPLTDRISVSFPFSPGPKTIKRDVRLSWDD